MKRQTYFVVCRYTFLYGYALMVVFAKWRPASLYERMFVVILSWGFSYSEAFCPGDGTCLQHCDCSWTLLLTFICK